MIHRLIGRLKPAFAKGLMISALLGVGERAWAVTEFRGFARSKSALYQGPGEGYGKFEDKSLEENEEVHVLGTSIGGSWTQVLTDEGIEAWVPASRLNLRRVLPGEYDRFLLLIDKKRRITTRLGLNFGGVYRNKPDGLGAGVQIAFNVAPNGFATMRADQLELVSGYFFHFKSRGGGVERPQFSEIPLQLMWLFRIGRGGDFLLGPTFGASYFTEAYEADTTRKFSAVGGVHMRYFFGEYAGLFVEFDTIGLEFDYLKLTTGFSLRY